jgi:hypothetical protein
VPTARGHGGRGEPHGVGAVEQRAHDWRRRCAAPRVALPEQLARRLPKVVDLVLHCLPSFVEESPKKLIDMFLHRLPQNSSSGTQ